MPILSKPGGPPGPSRAEPAAPAAPLLPGLSPRREALSAAMTGGWSADLSLEALFDRWERTS